MVVGTIFTTLLLATTAQASTFLGAHPHVEMQSMPTQEVDQILYSELSLLSGDLQLSAMREELRPLFAALPKNADGKLDPVVVRYALHRYFAGKYGWHLRGLEPQGGAWNASSSATIMKDRVPVYIQGIFEQRHGQGLGLEELAVFAITLADLVRQEAVTDLEEVYAALGVSKAARLTEGAAGSILKTYLMMYTTGAHAQENRSHDFEQMEAALVEDLIVWFDAKSWIQDLRYSTDYLQRARRNPFTHEYGFDHVADVAQDMGHRFGAFQNLECQSLKQKLVEMEHEGSGRVTLSAFYGGIEDRDWPFIESVDYLRNLGALDESNAAWPAVIIPNFLSSPSNCVAPSSFYSVCCIDECEGLLAQVELKVAGPAATAARLAEVISRLQSDTVEAPRNLSLVELARLDEIAEHHGGLVPLHGRLFAQWMHHAYPRECRFPQLNTQPLTQKDFKTQYGVEAEVSDHEVERYTWKASDTTEPLVVTLPWHKVEDLVAPHSSTLQLVESRISLRGPALLVLLTSAIWPLLRTSKQLAPLVDKQDRYLV